MRTDHRFSGFDRPCLGFPALVAAGLVALTVGCAASGGEATTKASPYSATLPDVPALTRGDIEELLAALADDSRTSVPLPPVAASAFDVGSPTPNRSDPSWSTLLTQLRQVRGVAVSGGWSLLVEGWTDSSGPRAFNVPLSQARADSTRDALVTDGYPADTVRAVGRGVGGSDATDRRVVVSFVRDSPAPEEST